MCAHHVTVGVPGSGGQTLRAQEADVLTAPVEGRRNRSYKGAVQSSHFCLGLGSPLRALRAFVPPVERAWETPQYALDYCTDRGMGWGGTTFSACGKGTASAIENLCVSYSVSSGHWGMSTGGGKDCS